MPFPELLPPSSSTIPPQSGLEVALFNFVKVAQMYNSDERSRQLKQFLIEHPHYLPFLTELIYQIHEAGVPLAKSPEELTSTEGGGCLCPNCPYKQQLSQLEELYLQYVNFSPQPPLTANGNGATAFRNNSIDF
jgi:hypothetical protein